MNPSTKTLEHRDVMLANFFVRVYPSGSKVYYVDCNRKKIKLGSADVLTAVQAREMARVMLGRVAQGLPPVLADENAQEGNTTGDEMLLKDFVNNIYSPWVKQHRRAGEDTLKMIKRTFAGLLKKRICDIKKHEAIEIQTKLIARGLKKATINRVTTALKGALSWGVKTEWLSRNPLERLPKLREDDSRHIIRYLSVEERKRLMKTIEDREDHIKPMVILSLNTGIRQGTLFALKWEDINFTERTITLRASIVKAMKHSVIPVNGAAIDALLVWQEVLRRKKITSDLVFPSPQGGGEMDNVKKAWAATLKEAEIESFRWHDMRHDFASQLVMKGVDLNTVRELLGHGDIKMTLKYAHLAPEVKRSAVDLL